MASDLVFKTIKHSVFSNRDYRIEVEHYDNNTAFALVWAKHIYKHRAHHYVTKMYRTRYKNKDKKVLGDSLRWFEPSHFLADYAKDYADYHECLDKLQRSHCAREWFKNIMKPYLVIHQFV